MTSWNPSLLGTFSARDRDYSAAERFSPATAARWHERRQFVHLVQRAPRMASAVVAVSECRSLAELKKDMHVHRRPANEALAGGTVPRSARSTSQGMISPNSAGI